MTMLCERCYGVVDPMTDRYYRLAHLQHADLAGNVTWRDAVVHVDACPAAGSEPPVDRQGRAA